MAKNRFIKSQFVNHEPAKQYHIGFNRGYMLAQILPTLTEQIMDMEGDENGLRGFRDGAELYRLEVTRGFLLDKKAIDAEVMSMNFKDDWLKSRIQGYELAEKMPDMVSMIMTAEMDNPSRNMEALKEGITSYLHDSMSDLKRAWDKSAKDSRPDPSHDIPHDLDKDPDLER